MSILLSGIGEGIVGAIGFIIAMALLVVFLHWLSGVTNTKFETRIGGSTIADNTAINRPNYVKANKSDEQILIEEKLLSLRIALRESQYKIINGHKLREKELKQIEIDKDTKYENDLKKYESDLLEHEEKVKALDERLKKENLSAQEKSIIEIQKLGIFIKPRRGFTSFDSLVSTVNYYEIEEKHRNERQLMRYEHSKLIEFENDFEKMKFIERDSELPITRTKSYDLNARTRNS